MTFTNRFSVAAAALLLMTSKSVEGQTFDVGIMDDEITMEKDGKVYLNYTATQIDVGAVGTHEVKAFMYNSTTGKCTGTEVSAALIQSAVSGGVASPDETCPNHPSLANCDKFNVEFDIVLSVAAATSKNEIWTPTSDGDASAGTLQFCVQAELLANFQDDNGNDVSLGYDQTVITIDVELNEDLSVAGNLVLDATAPGTSEDDSTLTSFSVTAGFCDPDTYAPKTTPYTQNDEVHICVEVGADDQDFVELSQVDGDVKLDTVQQGSGPDFADQYFGPSNGETGVLGSISEVGATRKVFSLQPLGTWFPTEGNPDSVTISGSAVLVWKAGNRRLTVDFSLDADGEKQQQQKENARSLQEGAVEGEPAATAPINLAISLAKSDSSAKPAYDANTKHNDNMGNIFRANEGDVHQGGGFHLEDAFKENLEEETYSASAEQYKSLSLIKFVLFLVVPAFLGGVAL